MKNFLNLIIISTICMCTACTKEFISSNDNKIDNKPIEYVIDIEGNKYKTTQIGTQVWMSENLKTTKYNDGIALSNVTSNESWGTSNYGIYCDFANNPLNSAIYGRLYNYYAIASNKLCPNGWHVPSNQEWDVLINFLGGPQIAGNKLKEEGTNHWNSPNNGADNSNNFTALPGGLRDSYGNFSGIGTDCRWWTSSIDNQDIHSSIPKSLGKYLFNNNSVVYTSPFYRV